MTGGAASGLACCSARRANSASSCSRRRRRRALILPEAASLFGAVVTLSMATDAVPDEADRLARPPRGAARDDLDGPEKSPETPVHRRRLWPVRPDRRADADGQEGRGDADRQGRRDDRRQRANSATKVYFGDGTRIDLLRTAGAGEARAIIFCNDNDDGALSHEALAKMLEAFPQAAVMVRAFDRRHLLSLRALDLAYAQREMFESAVKMGRQGAQAGRDSTAKSSTGSSASIAGAIASDWSGRARPAIFTPGDRACRSAPADRWSTSSGSAGEEAGERRRRATERSTKARPIPRTRTKVSRRRRFSCRAPSSSISVRRSTPAVGNSGRKPD